MVGETVSTAQPGDRELGTDETEGGRDGNKTVLSGVPDALPALIKAYRIRGQGTQCGL